MVSHSQISVRCNAIRSSECSANSTYPSDSIVCHTCKLRRKLPASPHPSALIMLADVILMRLDRVVSVLVIDASMNLFRLMTFVCILVPPLVVRLLQKRK